MQVIPLVRLCRDEAGWKGGSGVAWQMRYRLGGELRGWPGLMGGSESPAEV